MARVFLTVAPGPAGVQKLLVVKELRPDLGERPDLEAMFLNEARLAARLNHPNVVQTYEVGEDEGRHFLVLEYLEGQSLDRVWKRMKGLLPLEQQLRILCEVLAGLDYAHELTDYDGTPLGVVHRDVSPHNVFLTYDGQVKLVDFGIAKVVDVDGGTKAGLFKGKAKYTSPEQAVGGAVDRRADLFSVGIMLWEVLTGRRLWGDKTEIQVLLELTQGQWPSPREVSPSVTPELDAICCKAMAFHPRDRFPTAAAMRDALEHVLEGAPRAAPLRQLGQRVAEVFAAERARIRAQVDEQVRAFAALPPEATRVPALPTLQEELSGSDKPQPGGFTPLGTSRSAPPPASTGPRWAVLAVAVVAASAAGTFALVRGQGPRAAKEAAASALVVARPAEPGAAPSQPVLPASAAKGLGSSHAAPPASPAAAPPPPEPSPSATAAAPSAPPAASPRVEAAHAEARGSSPRRSTRAPSTRAPAMTEVEARPTKPRHTIDEQDPYAK